MTSAEPWQGTRWRVPVAKLRTHNAIVDRLGLAGGDVLLDLGCGNGFTLATAASRVPDVSLVGVDLDVDALNAAASWLEEIGARHQLYCADLDGPIPVPDASVTHVVSHDVLECLEDPVALLVEASRVMRPGGTSVWSHVDYESVVISGPDRRLTRRMVQAYADASTGHRSDAQMGRRLAALVADSPLECTAVDAHVLVATQLDGPAGRRVDDMVSTVRGAAGRVGLSPSETDRWLEETRRADELGRFFYSQTAYIVTARS